ncbi:MAG: single-stranded DNA-binding protein [Oscillospiraceae bacterium]|jgi:single-strand DNA-binding protein|nr:single-stranded DNA-binding protein [Oscillospiraceae bacterium]
MLNHILIMGRLTRDPELRHTQNQVPVASFTLAVDRDFMDKDTGQRQTDFIDCVAWRNTAEFVCRNFVKGQMAIVSGRLQIRDYTDKEGNKRKAAEVVADQLYFGEPKRNPDQRPGGYQQGAYSQPQNGGYQSGAYNQGSYGQAGGGYNSQPAQNYNSAPAQSYNSPAPSYAAPAQGYNSPAPEPAEQYAASQYSAPAQYNAPAAPPAQIAPPVIDFKELDDDGDLPF